MFSSSLRLSDSLSPFTQPIVYSLTYYHSSCLPSHLPFFSCLNGQFFIPLFVFCLFYSWTLRQLCSLMPLFFLQPPILLTHRQLLWCYGKVFIYLFLFTVLMIKSSVKIWFMCSSHPLFSLHFHGSWSSYRNQFGNMTFSWFIINE